MIRIPRQCSIRNSKSCYKHDFEQPFTSPSSLLHRKVQRLTYFTNGDRVKDEDPFAVLGLTWGATNSEIKEAYRKLAQKYHPDAVGSKTMDGSTKASSIEAFQKIQRAYSCLMNVQNVRFSHASKDALEIYSFQTWRQADIIAQERTDVAGLLRKRPIQPVTDGQRAIYSLGQPDGSGIRRRREEYVTDGSDDAINTVRSKKNTGTVGTGKNKWTTPPQWKPWIPNDDRKI